MTSSETIDTGTLVETIRAAATKGELVLPPLPALAARVSALLRDDEHSDSRSVAEVLKNDPAIVATVLRISNSASYGGLQPITDLGQAIARLGLRQVGSIVTAVSHKGQFQSRSPERAKLLEDLWGHAVAVALGAKRLAVVGRADGEQAFLAGLLHDTGRLVVIKWIDEAERRSPTTRFTAALTDELMEALHAELGHRTLVAWKIPEPICGIALNHHAAQPRAEDMLLLRVQAANAFAKKLGADPEPEPDMDLLEIPAVEALRIGELELAALMVDLEDEIARVRALL
jgi:HD-like signal output (HDOD) protein